MEGHGVARDIVLARFPDAVAAYLAGSSSNCTATALSDLDVVVVLDGPPAPYRESIRWGAQPVELFVHDEASLGFWYEREAAEFCPVLAHMVATGVVVVGGAEALRLKSAAKAQFAAGPAPLSEASLARRRYLLTDALDDLESAVDPDERDAVAGVVLTRSAELLLLHRGHWLGTSKWLVRRLKELDPRRAEALMAAHRVAVGTGDTHPLTAEADAVLRDVGGRLTEGYRTG